MLNKIGLLMLLQMCLLMSSTFAAGITIVVAPEVSIEGTVMTLGQLSEISGDDTPWVNSLRQLKLGSAPPPGSSIVLTKELLDMRLAATGSNFSGIVWKIPDSITVTTRSQSISGQVLLDNAILAIAERSGSSVSSGELSITPIGSVQDIVIPMGDIVLTKDLPYGIHYNTPTTVQMTINVNGQVFTKKTLRFDVKLYRPVAVATSQVSPGEILTTDKLRYERMDTGRLGSGYYTDLNKVLGLATRRSLTPGMVITDSMVNKPVLIKRGSIVNLVARIGSMEVTAAGQAMQDGREGELIRVQNINSTKIISAKVLDANTVQVLTYKSNGY